MYHQTGEHTNYLKLKATVAVENIKPLELSDPWKLRNDKSGPRIPNPRANIRVALLGGEHLN